MHFARSWIAPVLVSVSINRVVRLLSLGCVSLGGALSATPVVTKITPPPDGTYGEALNHGEHRVYLVLTFSEPIKANDSSRVQIRVGSTSRESLSPIAVSTFSISYSLVPEPGDNGPLTVTGPIMLHGGTITGEDGTPAVLTFAPVSFPGVIFDLVTPEPPVIKRITPVVPSAAEKVTVTGTAEPRTTLYYGVDAPSTTAAPVDENGNWSVTVGPLAAGTHSFGANVMDAGGNFPGFLSQPVTSLVFAVRASGALSPEPSRLINISSRLWVDGGDAGRILITGFVIRGGGPARLLLRGVGPSLGRFGVISALPNPRLRLFDGGGRVLMENDNWFGADVSSTATSVGAFPLEAASLDAAFVQSLSPGPYSVQVLGTGGSGIALAEVFDASSGTDSAQAALSNLSTRGVVGAGEAQLAAGFVISGPSPMRILVRGVGPALASFGVTDALSDPELTLFRSDSSTPLARNFDWSVPPPTVSVLSMGTPVEIALAAKAAGAFELPMGSKDAALLVTLTPGAYTAVASGSSGASGTALVEVYEVR